MNQTIFQDEDKNAIRYSLINHIDTEIEFNGFGVKYVASGAEIYHVNGRKYKVEEGQYIIGNDFTKASVQINLKKQVQGLCIDISPKVINEVAMYNDISESELAEFLLSDQFFVNRYNIKNTTLGYTLHEINQQIKNGKFVDDFQHEELFYSLAESIVTDQRVVLNHLSKLNFKKQETNHELFRILLKAKDIMDTNLFDSLKLDEITTASGISKYHFIRLFKSVFGISPYQYLKRQKLEYARQQLSGGSKINDLASLLGYPDTPSFSKAFKQIFGITPSSVKKQ